MAVHAGPGPEDREHREEERKRDLVGRLNEVLDKVYDGNISTMARDLGIDRATASRYVSGQRTPRRNVLELLSQKQCIELDWLEHGGSDAIAFKEQSSLSQITEYGLPVMSVPSETVPTVGSVGHLGMVLATLPTYYSEQRYWLRLAADDPDNRLKAGDHVLIDVCTPRAVLKADVGRLCVVKRADGVKFGAATEADAKGQRDARIVGAPVLLHRQM